MFVEGVMAMAVRSPKMVLEFSSDEALLLRGGRPHSNFKGRLFSDVYGQLIPPPHAQVEVLQLWPTLHPPQSLLQTHEQLAASAV